MKRGANGCDRTHARTTNARTHARDGGWVGGGRYCWLRRAACALRRDEEPRRGQVRVAGILSIPAARSVTRGGEASSQRGTVLRSCSDRALPRHRRLVAGVLGELPDDRADPPKHEGAHPVEAEHERKEGACADDPVARAWHEQQRTRVGAGETKRDGQRTAWASRSVRTRRTRRSPMHRFLIHPSTMPSTRRAPVVQRCTGRGLTAVRYTERRPPQSSSSSRLRTPTPRCDG